jgi:hypothetical protein
VAESSREQINKREAKPIPVDRGRRSGTQREWPPCLGEPAARRGVAQWAQCYIGPGRGLPMRTHTHTHRSSTTVATATDDPGLFVLAPARRRRPAQSGEGSLVEVQYKSCACISPFYPGTAVGGAESLSLSLSPPCAPLCFGRWRPLRLECNRGAASFDVIMHLAGVARDADPFALDSRREPALPRRARAGDWKGEGVPRAAAGAASGLSLGRR